MTEGQLAFAVWGAVFGLLLGWPLGRLAAPAPPDANNSHTKETDP